MSDDRRRDGSKLSFAERDKRRRERQSRGDGRPRGPAKSGADRSQKAYRAALEKAFESGKVDELAAALAQRSEPSRPARPPKRARPPKQSEPAPEPAPAARKKQAKKKPSRRRELTDNIRKADGSAKLSTAIDRYLGEFDSLPNDYELLEEALDHRSAEVVLTVLAQIEAQLGRSKPRRSRSLAMKLAILEDSHEDDDVCALAARVRAAL